MTDPKNIYIIYNPVSTGDSEANAKQLAKDLRSSGVTVKLLASRYKGHARQLGFEHAAHAGDYLISSSGDGTYNELINGVLSYTKSTPEAVTGLVPSGNANDHYNSVHKGDFIERLKSGDVQRIDCLEVNYADQVAYAHSYAGIGLSPQVGDELNHTKLNPVIEFWLVVKHLVRRRPAKILVDGHVQRFDSLVWSNVGQMSKVLTLSKKAKVDDGKFEINASPYRSIWKLLAQLLRHAVSTPEEPPRASKYTFQTIKRLKLQLDGEIIEIPPQTRVVVKNKPKALACVV